MLKNLKPGELLQYRCWMRIHTCEHSCLRYNLGSLGTHKCDEHFCIGSNILVSKAIFLPTYYEAEFFFFLQCKSKSPIKILFPQWFFLTKIGNTLRFDYFFSVHFFLWLLGTQVNWIKIRIQQCLNISTIKVF